MTARRHFLRQGASLAATLAVPGVGSAALPDTRRLALAHTHTGERLELSYAVDGRLLPGACAQLDRFLRDHYSGEVGRIDPALFDQLHRVQQATGGGVFEVISGYRCPSTNARLRDSRGGGVAKNSLHLEGRAIDLRLRGVALADLRDAALELRAGGVGFYPHEQFVHLDTGRVRRW